MSLSGRIQNTSFQEPNYLAVCCPECAGEIEPERIHTIRRTRTVTAGEGKDKTQEQRPLVETKPEKHLFPVARNLALDLKAIPGPKEYPENRAALTAAMPEHVMQAAANCAATIMADLCPTFIAANGAVRLRR